MTKMSLLFETLAHWWRTRHLTEQEYRQHLLQEVIDARTELLEAFKDEPASRELIDTFEGIDQFIEQAKVLC